MLNLVWCRPQISEDATSGPGDVRGLEAALLVHRVDGDGHLPLAGEDVATLRDLQVHHGEVPVLQEQHTALAELPPAQPEFQRLLHQGAQAPHQARQGRLLDPPPQGHRHV